MSNSYVKSKTSNGIATITFYTPQHNALPTSILQKLELAINTAGQEDEVKTIVLMSGGDRTFCAGASFDELMAIKNGTEGKAFFMGFANVILAMRNCGKIIIARVQGKAVGGGVGLAAAADYC
ncbi:MAG: enoyl-CoA hydratase-related protein, partial [Leeuwenhoekiella sp.]